MKNGFWILCCVLMLGCSEKEDKNPVTVAQQDQPAQSILEQGIYKGVFGYRVYDFNIPPDTTQYYWADESIEIELSKDSMFISFDDVHTTSTYCRMYFMGPYELQDSILTFHDAYAHQPHTFTCDWYHYGHDGEYLLRQEGDTVVIFGIDTNSIAFNTLIHVVKVE